MKATKEPTSEAAASPTPASVPTPAAAQRSPQRPLGPVRRLLWSMPLGWQLSGIYTLLLVITLTVVGLLVYTQQQDFLVQDAAARLEQAATRVMQSPDLSSIPDNGETGGPQGTGDRGIPGPSDQGRGFPGLDRRGTEQALVRGLSGPDVTVTLLDINATIVTTTQSLTGVQPAVEPVSAEQVANVVATGQSLHWIVQKPDGNRRVVVLVAVSNGLSANTALGASRTSTARVLEQSASLAAADASINRLGTYLLLGGILGTIAGLVFGLTFTRAVLRPLDHVADTAEAIAAGDMQRRLLLPPGRNEVARLGKTFDFMVGRLVSTLEAQRRFVADASHELRTPLTSLKGLAEILMIGAHGNDSRVIEQSAGAINGELERLIRLVTDLLTLSRFDGAGSQGAMPIRRQRLDICTSLEAAGKQMELLAEARDVRLRHSCAGPLPVMGDAGQVKQVLLNLLDNAVRHTPAGGEVLLSGTVEGVSAKIEVRDTGSGIEPRDLPHIFERFYRGDASRTRSTGNSGLGLAIAQTIIASHAGTIEVQSVVGSGTCFTIRLPLAPPVRSGPVEDDAQVKVAH